MLHELKTNKLLSISEFCKSSENSNLLKYNIELFKNQERILEEYYTSNKKDMTGILGRRSGKTLLSTVIAAYEIYRAIISDESKRILLLFNNSHQLESFKLDFKKLFGETVFFENCKHSASDFDDSYTFCHFSSSSITKKIDLIIRTYYSQNQIFYSSTRLYADIVIFDNVSKETKTIYSKYESSQRIVLTAPTQDVVVDTWLNGLCTKDKIFYVLPTWKINESINKSELEKNLSEMSYLDFNSEFGCKLNIEDPEATTTISFRLQNKLLESLKKQAREIAFNENKEFTYLDLIREKLNT